MIDDLKIKAMAIFDRRGVTLIESVAVQILEIIMDIDVKTNANGTQ